MLIIHNAPSGEAKYCGYDVRINGVTALPSLCRVSAVPYNTEWPGHQRPLDQTEETGFLSFECDGEVNISITYSTPPSEITVRPLSRGVKAKIDGSIASFTLSELGAYTVEADGYHHALHIFLNPIKSFESYTDGAKTVLRYGAGIHRIGRVELPSDTAVIIDSGAYIYGSFCAVCAHNISICGYGVIDGSCEARDNESSLLPLDYYATIPHDRGEILDLIRRRHSLDGILRFYNCENIHVEGVIMRDSSTFAAIAARCKQVIFENVKAIGMWRYNSDGIDLFNCRDCVISHSFMRNFDDCIVLKGICGWDNENMENILVTDCVTWCDWGRNLEIGAETNADSFKNITFKNCDCIHGSSIFLDIHHHNRAHISDVIYENINIEYTRHQLSDVYQSDMSLPYPHGYKISHPLLIGIPIYASGLFSKDGKHGDVKHISFKNINIISDIPLRPVIMIRGLDTEHTVSDVTLSGLTLNGTPLRTSDIDLAVNDFAESIKLE